MFEKYDGPLVLANDLILTFDEERSMFFQVNGATHHNYTVADRDQHIMIFFDETGIKTRNCRGDCDKDQEILKKKEEKEESKCHHCKTNRTLQMLRREVQMVRSDCLCSNQIFCSSFTCRQRNRNPDSTVAFNPRRPATN